MAPQLPGLLLPVELPITSRIPLTQGRRSNAHPKRIFPTLLGLVPPTPLRTLPSVEVVQGGRRRSFLLQRRVVVALDEVVVPLYRVPVPPRRPMVLTVRPTMVGNALSEMFLDRNITPLAGEIIRTVGTP